MVAGTLLIVDDSPKVRSALRDYMTRVAGWPVVLTAPDAGQALLIAADKQPEAIVLDNRMPGADGIDILADLRRVCPAARIIMHTTDVTLDLTDRASAGGANATVAKGAPLDELAALLTVA